MNNFIEQMGHLKYNEFWSLREGLGKDLHLLPVRKMLSDWDLNLRYLTFKASALTITILGFN